MPEIAKETIMARELELKGDVISMRVYEHADGIQFVIQDRSAVLNAESVGKLFEYLDMENVPPFDEPSMGEIVNRLRVIQEPSGLTWFRVFDPETRAGRIIALSDTATGNLYEWLAASPFVVE